MSFEPSFVLDDSYLEPDIVTDEAYETASDLGDSDYDYDNDNASGSDLTIRASIRNYVYENGRRYHAFHAGIYPMPNDELEQDRLDTLHHIYRLLAGGDLYMAPLKDKKVGHVLDIGTGTGIWSVEFAEEHPEATVLGTDLSPIQTGWKPPNVHFEIEDVEDTWSYITPFDYIYSRNMAQAIRDWPKLLEQMYTHLNPGGYIEISEAATSVLSDDNSVPPDAKLQVLVNKLTEALNLIGMPDPIPKLEQMIAETGFTDIQIRRRKLPWSPYAKNPRLKEIGLWAQRALESGLKAYGGALFTRVLGMDPKEVDKLCEGAHRELFDKSLHAYNIQWYFVARKPMGAPVD